MQQDLKAYFLTYWRFHINRNSIAAFLRFYIVWQHGSTGGS